MTIEEFYTKIKGVWDELDALDPIAICNCNGCECELTKKATVKSFSYSTHFFFSDHICFQINLFSEYRKIEGKQHFITIPNGKQVKVDFIGNIILPNGLKLTGVLFVPSFHFNLVSVSKLVRDLKCTLWFNANYCFVQGSLKKGPLLLGKAQNVLYYIEDIKDTSTQIRFQASLGAMQQRNNKAYDAKLWHIRMGHLPFSKLGLLFSDIHQQRYEKDFICTICPLAKKTRNVFCKSSIKSVEIFQLIHVDIWGPMRHPSRLNRNLFITIVDDYSRFTWVFFIKQKI